MPVIVVLEPLETEVFEPFKGLIKVTVKLSFSVSLSSLSKSSALAFTLTLLSSLTELASSVATGASLTAVTFTVIVVAEL